MAKSNAKYCFGVDIGGTTVKLGLFTKEGEVLDKWEIPTNRENHGESVPGDIAASILAKLEEKNINKDEVIGMGCGVPGPMKQDGTVLKCANLGWDIFNVNEKMEQLTGITCAAGNDANVAALGEMWKGAGAGYKNMVMVTLGTGVGGGVIVDGKMIAGSNGAGGEIGHMVVNPAETAICGCGGHGHLEQYASATGVVRMATEQLKSETRQTALRNFEKLTAKDIFDQAKAGDEVAVELVDKLGFYLGFALGNVACVCDPQAFIIGGGVSRAGDILIDAISKHYNENVMFALKNKDFKIATLGNDAGIYGSAKLILDVVKGEDVTAD